MYNQVKKSVDLKNPALCRGSVKLEVPSQDPSLCAMHSPKTTYMPGQTRPQSHHQSNNHNFPIGSLIFQVKMMPWTFPKCDYYFVLSVPFPKKFIHLILAVFQPGHIKRKWIRSSCSLEQPQHLVSKHFHLSLSSPRPKHPVRAANFSRAPKKSLISNRYLSPNVDPLISLYHCNDFFSSISW